MLADGTPAPAFELDDQDGTRVSLDSLRGSWVVLWWFPKAATAGWTIEGQGFRDRAPSFSELGAEIVGISFDTPAEQKAFAEAQAFPFRLLCDVDHTVGVAYEAKKAPDEQWPMVPRRITYLIDPTGTIRRGYAVTDVKSHPDEVLADLGALAD